MFAKYASILFLAAVAVTAQTTESTVSDVQCGEGQTVSCCNTSTSILDSIGGVVLGNSCSPIAGGVGDVPISNACGDNTAMCCTGDQNGLVNVQCTSIPVN